MADGESDVLLTVRDVMQLTKFKESTVYAKARKGEFPRPIRCGGASRWIAREVQNYIRQRMADRSGAGASA